MGIGVLKVTVTVNAYWDMTSFSLVDRYYSYVEKSRSGFFRKFGMCILGYTTSHPGRQPFILFPSMCKHVHMYASHTRSKSTINLSDMISRFKVRIDIRVCSCVVFVWSWSHAVREKRGLRMSENKVLWRTFVIPLKKCQNWIKKEREFQAIQG